MHVFLSATKTKWQVRMRLSLHTFHTRIPTCQGQTRMGWDGSKGYPGGGVSPSLKIPQNTELGLLSWWINELKRHKNVEFPNFQPTNSAVWLWEMCEKIGLQILDQTNQTNLYCVFFQVFF